MSLMSDTFSQCSLVSGVDDDHVILYCRAFPNSLKVSKEMTRMRSNWILMASDFVGVTEDLWDECTDRDHFLAA